MLIYLNAAAIELFSLVKSVVTNICMLGTGRGMVGYVWKYAGRKRVTARKQHEGVVP
jgi:hypothetical protein